MTKGFNERIYNFLIEASPVQRRVFCRDEPLYFFLYYFPEYFDYRIPPFHFDFYQDIKDLSSGTLAEAMWCTYRDSAKTSIAKIAFACWLICYKKKLYINWDSYDGDNGEAALFDITVALQTNKKIIKDFGHLYYKKQAKDVYSEAKMKRIKSFITENKVRVQAYTTQESTRGRLYGNQRPDCFIFDDFENSKTAISYLVTKKIKDHIDELRSGLPANACVLYLCNYITEEGSVAYLMNKIKENPRGRVRFIPVEDKEKNISWPDKFVHTAKEAIDLNSLIKDSRKWKLSLEDKRKSLGRAVYEAEMMNNPAHGPDKVFDREMIEELMKKTTQPKKEVANLKTWADYNPSHRYALGADVAKGVGIDSSTTAIIDFSVVPNRVVATYKNNLIQPDIFAYDIKRHAEAFGECLVAPENNNNGAATLSSLKKIYPLKNIYLPVKEEKVKKPVADEYGWETNSATKPEMIYQLRSAIEDGHLIIPDMDVLNEAKYYSLKDLQTFTLVDGMTRHFDLLIAVAIAWQMRNHAVVSTKNKKPFVQGQHVAVADQYGG